MQVVRVPDRLLAAPQPRPLPEPPPLRAMVGPSLILAGLSIGSGELVLWPRLTVEWGFAVFWAAWVGVTIQFFLNMEILAAGVAVLFSTELALLDAVSRVLADLLALTWFRDSPRWTVSRLYFAGVWALIGFGIAVLIAGFDQPFVLLVVSASLNGVVMFLYSGLLLVLNLRSFRAPLRPGRMRIAALLVSLVFFGYLSVWTLVDRLNG